MLGWGGGGALTTRARATTLAGWLAAEDAVPVLGPEAQDVSWRETPGGGGGCG